VRVFTVEDRNPVEIDLTTVSAIEYRGMRDYGEGVCQAYCSFYFNGGGCQFNIGDHTFGTVVEEWKKERNQYKGIEKTLELILNKVSTQL